MKISVCIATYNGESYILKQLRSILPQLDNADEIILVDDASSDLTLKVVEGIGDRRVKVYSNPFNLGVVPTFNRALDFANGDLIFLSDQDDEWIEDKVSKIKNIFESTEVDLLVHDAMIVSLGEGLTGSLFAYLGSSKGIYKNIVSNTFTGCCMAFRKEILTNILPVPNRTGIYHDAWIGIFSQISGYKVLFLNEPLIKFNRHANNVSTLKRRNICNVLVDRFNLITSIIARSFFIKVNW